jgi:hypothetical protein
MEAGFAEFVVTSRSVLGDLVVASNVIDPRPINECKRCSYLWRQQEVDVRSRFCPRCGSASWDIAPTRSNARRPEDPPNPRWKKRKYDLSYEERKYRGEVRDKEETVLVGKMGIPNNYILDPYVPKIGLPPPPPRIIATPQVVTTHRDFPAESVGDVEIAFPDPPLDMALAAAQGED